MNLSLAKLDEWLREHRADFYPKLNPPASEQQLMEIESELGLTLPQDFRELLLWKNGQQDQATDTFHPLTGEMFMSADGTVQTMRDMKELIRYGDVGPDSWNSSWIPFMSNGGGDHSCLDTRSGAVVAHDHETQVPAKRFDSLEEWLAALVTELATCAFAGWDFKEHRC